MRDHRIECVLAGILFIIATAATMASQIIIEPMLATHDVAERAIANRVVFVSAVLLEVINAVASAGIAIAFFPILWRCARVLATAYMGLRAIEASAGILAAASFMVVLTPADSATTIALHDQAFILLLLLFSLSTLILYPALFHFRLVPVLLSVWGLVGGLSLMASMLLIMFGKIEMASTTDLSLSLPIWINEMILAIWLIFRGVDLSRVEDVF